MLPGPPTLYQSILAHPDRASADLSSLRLAVTGAAAIPVELVHRMRDELGFETVITGYGLTECCGIVSMCRFDDDPETIATTSGRAIPGIEVRCVDEKGAEVARGEPGEVVVRGYNVMQGYFEDAAETAKTIDADGWLHTGDVAVMDARGYLRITDRIKDLFITGGFNCYPAEIENLLYAQRLVRAGRRDRRPRRAHGRGRHGVRRAGAGQVLHAGRRDRVVPRRTWPTTRSRGASRSSTRCR